MMFRWLLILVLALTASMAVQAKYKKQWRLECTGEAQSSGSLIVTIRKTGFRSGVAADVPVERGMTSEEIAQTIEYALGSATNNTVVLDKNGESCDFIVQSSDSDDRLSLELTQNTVAGVDMQIHSDDSAAFNSKLVNADN